jgi:hypothetical protein
VANPQSLNRYAYALDDPCSLSDPLGLFACSYYIALLSGKNSPLSEGDVLKGLENEITRIFNLAGLGVNLTTGGGDYTLVITDQPWQGLKIDQSAVGFTAVDKNGAPVDRGWVFAGRLEQFDPATQTNTAFLGIGLGRAGAHEMGHFFLGLAGHEPSGIMQAGFTGSAWHMPDAAGQFAFTSDDAQKLRADCAKRHPHAGARRGPYVDVPAGGDWGSLLGLDAPPDASGSASAGDDVGPGSGWCPSCPPPVLIPRGGS